MTPRRRRHNQTRRPNPFTGARAANGSDWPRNGAVLKGITHEKDGKMWLQVNEIQQAGTEGFKDVRGQEKWMPDNGGSWNGGQWLHEPKEYASPPSRRSPVP